MNLLYFQKQRLRHLGKVKNLQKITKEGEEFFVGEGRRVGVGGEQEVGVSRGWMERGFHFL